MVQEGVAPSRVALPDVVTVASEGKGWISSTGVLDVPVQIQTGEKGVIEIAPNRPDAEERKALLPARVIRCIRGSLTLASTLLKVEIDELVIRGPEILVSVAVILAFTDETGSGTREIRAMRELS